MTRSKRAGSSFVFVPLFLNGILNPAALPVMKDGARVSIALAENCPTQGAQSVFHVEVASSEPAQKRGLGGRKQPLGPSEGMIFVYPAPRVQRFWMKQTLIPLGLLHFDPDGKLIRTDLMEVENDPENPVRIFSSERPSPAALEISPAALARIPKGAAGKIKLCIKVRS